MTKDEWIERAAVHYKALVSESYHEKALRWAKILFDDNFDPDFPFSEYENYSPESCVDEDLSIKSYNLYNHGHY